jgi:YedE family putative selenium metabolism protein
MKLFLKSKTLIVLAGLIFGSLAALMTNWGNPPNLGICVACFTADTVGALGLHQARRMQYIRPEIIGFVLGAFITSYVFREFHPRGGSSPLVRFLLGAFVMIGALVFCGCPTRMILRLAGGDLNGLTAMSGLVVGVLIGIFFLKRGFNLGRAFKMSAIAGWLLPGIMLGLLLLAIFLPGFIYTSVKGPGAVHAPLGISLSVGLVVGFLAQRTRMCFVGGWRDLFLVKNSDLFSGIAAFFIAALVTNYAVGNFTSGGLYHWGFTEQASAHDNHLWNFLSMSLVGLGATLLSGCPLRQMILSAGGDTDAGITVLGLFAGAAVAYNFYIASSSQGTGVFGPVAVITGLIFCLTIGFFVRDRVS